ncbi:hypothetical protein V5O48_010782 [Marasmius crinis-equi]|uniref:Uncharacterized protein n=1 Tax=Marasmius crinis-equi TaxID=585013 RepID=A0ABR3F7G2_9AGAR
MNTLVRDTMRETLSIKQNYMAFAQPGVSDKHLRLFNADPETDSPKVWNSFIDKNKLTTKGLVQLLWDMQLKDTLVALVKDTA